MTAKRNPHDIPISDLNVEAFLSSLFPQTVRNGRIDIGGVLQQCQYRANAILALIDMDASGTRRNQLPDAIDGVHGYVALSNSLIDYVLR